MPFASLLQAFGFGQEPQEDDLHQLNRNFLADTDREFLRTNTNYAAMEQRVMAQWFQVMENHREVGVARIVLKDSRPEELTKTKKIKRNLPNWF